MADRAPPQSLAVAPTAAVPAAGHASWQLCGLQTIGGRKFVVTVLAQLFATALQWAGKLDSSGTAYAMVMAATAGAFVAGNVAQKVRAPNTPSTPQQPEHPHD